MKIIKNEDKKFYNCVIGLMLADYKKTGITLEQAEELYDRFNIITIYKNGKVDFINERD